MQACGRLTDIEFFGHRHEVAQVDVVPWDRYLPGIIGPPNRYYPSFFSFFG